MFPYHAPGTPPATLIAPPGARQPVITLMEFDGETLEEGRVASIEETFACRDNSKLSWINIDGLADVELFRALGRHFGLHPLALEDVLHVPQRPKFEEYSDHFFIVAQMVYCDAGDVEFEQVSIFLGRNFLITIQEEALRDVFEPVRTRLRLGRGFIRTMRHDYLAYALLDAIVDHFFPVLEVLGERVENLEDRVIEHPTRESVVEIHDLKRQLLRLRRSAWPQREVVNALSRDESGLVRQETKAFLRDCYDHTVQIMDLIESYRDVTTGMMDLYLSSLGIRTNEIMRVLTVVTTIFIPLTFIVGVYGMNFENMPELKTRHGYFIVLAGMAAVAIGMLLFFKRKRWL
jgi:magnesium transporter